MPKSKKGFLVRFEMYEPNPKKWEQRIKRPVDDTKLRDAVVNKVRAYFQVVSGPAITVVTTSDYGGQILVGTRVAGDYLIVPGSEK